MDTESTNTRYNGGKLQRAKKNNCKGMDGGRKKRGETCLEVIGKGWKKRLEDGKSGEKKKMEDWRRG